MGSFSETRIDPFISWLGLLPIRVLSPQTGQVKRGGGVFPMIAYTGRP